jgi:hypothetical protein
MFTKCVAVVDCGGRLVFEKLLNLRAEVLKQRILS